MLRNLDDVVYADQLWMIHVGHSWSVFRIPSGDVESVMAKIRPTFPRAAEIRVKKRISNALELKVLARAANIDEDTVLSQLNTKPGAAGCDFIIGIKGWGC